MALGKITRYTPDLNFSELNDTDRHALVAGVKEVAPTSPLFLNSPAIQASLAQMVAKDTALSQANLAVVNDRQKLRTDAATELTCRGALDGEIRTFATLTGNGATSPADLHSVGMPYREPTPTPTQPPTAPDLVDNKPPKKGHGKTTVSVHDSGTTRRQYVAEWSPDPYGPTTWAQLGVGLGKTRVVTGASGTKVWVRFATVRGSLQSDWSMPFLVTIP